MITPIISWYVLEDIDGLFEYSPKRTHNMDGSYTPGETVSAKIQVWNNRLNVEDAVAANNAKLVIYFKNYEDNYLLNLCKVKLKGNAEQELEIDMDRGIIEIGDINGGANNGSELNVDNYVEFELLIGPLPSNMKSELKGLIIDLEYDK